MPTWHSSSTSTKSFKLKFLFQVVLKLFLNCCDSPILVGPQRCEKFDQKKEKLDSTDDRESSKKPHGATNKTELPFKLDLNITNYTRNKQRKLDLYISFDLVKCCRVKVDLDQVKTGCVEILT